MPQNSMTSFMDDPFVGGTALLCFIEREGKVCFCEMSAMVTNCKTDPL